MAREIKLSNGMKARARFLPDRGGWTFRIYGPVMLADVELTEQDIRDMEQLKRNEMEKSLVDIQKESDNG